jgi:TfoX/Sxy family transcriptional regulator of competence genes
VKLTSTVSGKSLEEGVREALREISGVEEKRMFGGTAFMVRGKMCITARDSRIMCRVDPLMHEELVRKEGCRTMTMRGREYRGYILVDKAVLGTRKELDYWVKIALDFNATTAKSK